VIGPLFAVSGVAAKATVENANVAAIAIMEIVFMFRLLRTGRLSPSMRAASGNTTK
jgi:hypothetical protein